MLRQMVQSQFLGLFDDEKKTRRGARRRSAAQSTPATEPALRTEDRPR